MNLVNVGDERLEKFGDTRAYVFEGQEFSSSRLNEMGRRLAAGLKSLGIGRGDHVVVSLSCSDRTHHVSAGRG
jgi:non-ribosomal peptide synthetase component E (peptide arylation enzyme)